MPETPTFTHEDVRLAEAAAVAALLDDHYLAGELRVSDWSEGREQRIAQQYRALAEKLRAHISAA